MARMVRKQLYLDEDQDRELSQRAKLLGVSQAELVRVAVDRLLAEERPDARDLAWAELMRGWADADKRHVGSGGRKWTREELHER